MARLNWLDIGKGIGILLVVIGHSVRGAGAEDIIRFSIFSFHMPLFFIYAGFTLRPKPVADVARASFSRLLVPYLILAGINELLVVARTGLTFDVVKHALSAIVWSSAVPVKSLDVPAIGMIWFLMVLFVSKNLLNAYLLYSKIANPLINLVILSALAAVGIVVGDIVLLPLSLDLVPLSMLFMYAGYVVKAHDLLGKAMRWYVVVLAAAVWVLAIYVAYQSKAPFSMGDRNFDCVAVCAVGALAGTLVVTKLSMVIDRIPGALRQALIFFGVNSFAVYAYHYLGARFLGWLDSALNNLPCDWVLIAGFQIAVICLLMALSKKMPISSS